MDRGWPHTQQTPALEEIVLYMVAQDPPSSTHETALNWRWTIVLSTKHYTKVQGLMIVIFISSNVSGLHSNKKVILVFLNISCGRAKQHSPMKVSLSVTTATGGHRTIPMEHVREAIKFNGLVSLAIVWMGHTHSPTISMALYIVYFCEKLCQCYLKMCRSQSAVIRDFSMMGHRTNRITTHIILVEGLDMAALYCGLWHNRTKTSWNILFGTSEGTHLQGLTIRHERLWQNCMLPWWQSMWTFYNRCKPVCVIACWQMQCGHFEHLM
jgi:hypothetical protein